jgi:hypothetical protein
MICLSTLYTMISKPLQHTLRTIMQTKNSILLVLREDTSKKLCRLCKPCTSRTTIHAITHTLYMQPYTCNLGLTAQLKEARDSAKEQAAKPSALAAVEGRASKAEAARERAEIEADKVCLCAKCCVRVRLWLLRRDGCQRQSCVGSC